MPLYILFIEIKDTCGGSAKKGWEEAGIFWNIRME